ncbi:uncharacterized protein LOC135384673 [Ornithodoros turicata]|uniref:uncharacterized protein LOC135384673 n=1 Tax=Ornithodoros turicata TaxID=34597 RepID=UPI0031388747
MQFRAVHSGYRRYPILCHRAGRHDSDHEGHPTQSRAVLPDTSSDESVNRLQTLPNLCPFQHDSDHEGHPTQSRAVLPDTSSDEHDSDHEGHPTQSRAVLPDTSSDEVASRSWTCGTSSGPPAGASAWIADVDPTSSDVENDPTSRSYEQGDQSFDTDILSANVCKCVSTTIADVMVLALAYVSRHQPTKRALLDLLVLINTIFQSNILPTSQYFFKKVFPIKAEHVSHHLYCPRCSFHLGHKRKTASKRVKCTNCNTEWNVKNVPSLIMLPLGPQIQFLFENNPCIQEHLSYRRDRIKSQTKNFEDILDGRKYTALSQPGEVLSSPENFSYSFNTDGAQVFKSTNTSVWPIHVMINELPPTLRQKHMLLAGMWYGKNKPDMNMFLGLFVEDAKKVFSGVRWKSTSGNMITSRFVGLCCCVDSVARAPMQNHIGFHGYYGCNWCCHKGEHFAKAMRFPVTSETPEQRTDGQALRQMQKALEENRPVCGFKGPAALINLPTFGIVSGFVPDYMHTVLLGVVRTVTGLWLSEAKELYYIGKKSTINLINKRIMQMSPPYSVSRLPRGITDHRLWKASEWKSWLLFYAFPCLKGILQEKYLKHFALLSEAMFILLKDSLSRSDINKADCLLLEFVCKMESLYGKAAMSFNVHCLTHLAKSVVDYGPLWAHSGFPFEAANGLLLKLFKGTRSVSLQIVQNFLLFRSVPYFSSLYNVQPFVTDYADHLFEHDPLQQTLKVGSVRVVGKGVRHGPVHTFRDVAVTLPSSSTVYKRMIMKRTMYHSTDYSRSHRRNNRTVCLTDGSYAEILRICVYESAAEMECVLLLMEYDCAHEFFSPHLTVCSSSERIRSCAPDALESRCMWMPLNDVECVVSKLPNKVENE